MSALDALFDALLLAGLFSFFCCVPVSIAGANATLGVVSGALAWRALRLRLDWSRLRHPLVLGLLVYCAVGAVCANLAVQPDRAWHPALKELHKLWVAAMLLLALEETPLWAAGCLGAGFVVTFAAGLWQTLTQRAPDASTWVRAHAWVHPVTFGEQVALAALGALCFLRSARGRGGARATGRAAAVVLALAAAALLLNQTRAALLGAVAGAAALAAADPGWRRRGAAAAVAAVAVAAVWEVMPTGHRSFGALLAGPGAYGFNYMRLALWNAALAMFRDHPWHGVGPGNFEGLFLRYHPQPLPEPVWGNAHNLYLHHLAERGALGLGALLALLAALGTRLWRRASRAPGPWTRWALAALAAFLVMSATEVTLQSEQLSALLFTILALAERQRRTA